MAKKTILITFIFFILISCGKKGDPEYKESKKISNSEYLNC